LSIYNPAVLPPATILKRHFDQGMEFDAFVQTGKADGHHTQWLERHSRLALDGRQSALVQGFTRTMHVLCVTGAWCGDCALQGAAMARIAESNPKAIHPRFLPRDDRFAELIVPNRINGGFRVPLTWFMAEDFEPVARFGDRTLSRYRSMARKGLPPEEAVLIPPPPDDPVREVLNEVLDEFERVQLLLRLSPRLRQLHGD